MNWRHAPRVISVIVFLLVPLVPLGGAAQEAPLRVAVLEFTNAAAPGELENLGKGLQAMFTTDLSELPSVQMLERARLSDVVDELKLGKSGLVDPKTASRIGKLAGATHILAGAFTVVGAEMRVDCRLFAVASGTTVIAESSQGEKDAFFELEKALVSKVVAKLGLRLAPKDRAKLAHPQTTDFDAFRSFSNGIALFDAKQYDGAIAALRAATNRDSDFKLASATLADYQRVIAEIRNRADELQASEQQLASLARQKASQEEASRLRGLFGLAARQGPDALIDRLAARRAIAEAYGNLSSDYRVLELQNIEDRFALQRTADAFTQGYYAEALRLAPRFPVVVRGEPWFPSVERKDEDYDSWWKKERASLDCSADCKRNTYDNFKWWDGTARPLDFFGRRLHLDARGEADLHRQLYQLAVKAGAPPNFRADALSRLATDYRKAGDFVRSTQALTELAGILDDPDKVRKVADEIELNRRVTEALAKSTQPALLREAFTLGPYTPPDRSLGSLSEPWFVDLFSTATPAPKALAELANWRRFPSMGNHGAWRSERYVWVGNQPVWLLQQEGYGSVTFAPRHDRYRADSIRFANVPKVGERRPTSNIDSLLVVEGVPRNQMALRFTVDFAPAADWWPPLVDPDSKTRAVTELVRIEGRPEVGVLFGLQDIDRINDDRKTHSRSIAAPLRGYLLVVDETGVRLSSIEGGTAPKRSVDAPGMFEPKDIVRRPIGETALDLRPAKRLDVKVSVVASTASITINGKALSFKLPAPTPTGFYGLQFRGSGYAAISKLDATSPR